MTLQSEFFRHICQGHSHEADVLMARMALNLAHDSTAYPFDLKELTRVRTCRRDFMTVGFNELFVADFLRAALSGELRPWRQDEVEYLERMVNFGEGAEKMGDPEKQIAPCNS